MIPVYKEHESTRRPLGGVEGQETADDEYNNNILLYYRNDIILRTDHSIKPKTFDVYRTPHQCAQRNNFIISFEINSARSK